MIGNCEVPQDRVGGSVKLVDWSNLSVKEDEARTVEGDIKLK